MSVYYYYYYYWKVKALLGKFDWRNHRINENMLQKLKNV